VQWNSATGSRSNRPSDWIRASVLQMLWEVQRAFQRAGTRSGTW
jgi:hypothetical protein